MTVRKVAEILRARPASDGNGVRLKRVFGGGDLQRFDPFLMLDEFGSDKPEDYSGGFPPHPHRGFETVTYMLNGKMEHQDHLGNIGLLSDGGVQWMTAGRGIIHSEMPRQTQGLMHGFQLWVNLPASEKMKPAAYRDIPAAQIPVYDIPGATVKAIAGEAEIGGKAINGYFNIADTRIVYFDIRLNRGATIDILVNSEFNSLLYVFTGQIMVAGATPVAEKSLARLENEGVITLSNSGDNDAAVLLMAGQPLQEPIVQYGPFVMNSKEEIDLAIQQYQAGSLTSFVPES